jgi:uncharacterized protein (TIGR03084 family)
MTDLIAAAAASLPELIGEWRDECADVLALIAGADDGVLDRATPAVGWDIGMQLAHLAHGDELAALAVTDSDGFVETVAGLMSGDIEAAVAAEMDRYRVLPAQRLVRAWQEQSRRLADALAARPASHRVTWITGPMSAASFVRARLMEAFAHGQDIRDALGAPPSESTRLRHVAYLGVRTREFSYAIRDQQAPEVPLRVELDFEDVTWTWGPADALDRIDGPTVDFCLVVTRRRHPDDTRLRIAGPAARQWMDFAQCYAGPPTSHRPAGSFVPSSVPAR